MILRGFIRNIRRKHKELLNLRISRMHWLLPGVQASKKVTRH